MFASLFTRYGEDDDSGEYGDDADLQTQPQSKGLFQDQQQNERHGQSPQDYGFKEGQSNQTELTAVWDRGATPQHRPTDDIATGSSSRNSRSQKAAEGRRKAQNSGSKSRSKQARNIIEPTEGIETIDIDTETQSFGQKGRTSQTQLNTVADAMEFCRNLVDEQVRKASDEQAQHNQPIAGDAFARRAILTLLPDAVVRLLFLETAGEKNALTRIRSLFGSPPYGFLNPEDASFIRAGGVAAGRTNMSFAANTNNDVASYSQFGAGHLVDTFEREYRVVSTTMKMEDSLPCDIRTLESHKQVLLNVRVPKRSRSDRMDMMKDATKRRKLEFPHINEEIVVDFTSALKRIWSTTDAPLNSRFRVKQVIPRAVGASTAALVAQKV